MIEIGEYVRTKKGEIMKVTSIPVEVDGKITYQTDKGWVELECDIVKHSKNIIDLIEQGDCLNGKIVKAVRSERIFVEIPHIDCKGYGNYYGYLDYEGIKTILTHEQYKRNCYRLEE